MRNLAHGLVAELYAALVQQAFGRCAARSLGAWLDRASAWPDPCRCIQPGNASCIVLLDTLLASELGITRRISRNWPLPAAYARRLIGLQHRRQRSARSTPPAIFSPAPPSVCG